MYFDEKRTLTESECSIVEEEECNLETVVRQVEREVTKCGTVEETVCLNVMDTRLEEECKTVEDRICQLEARNFSQVTEESDCKISTGSECVEAEDGEEAVLCETVMAEDCPELDCLPGSTDPRCSPNIDEYGAPLAPVVAQDSQCAPRTKQSCRVGRAVCPGAPGTSCSNVARELQLPGSLEVCQTQERLVCRNLTHWDTKQECHSKPVERCGTVVKLVDTPVQEKVCRTVTSQQCKDVTRTIVISVPRELHKKKCTNITVSHCGPVAVDVPERQCHQVSKPVCTVAQHLKCFDVQKEVSKDVLRAPTETDVVRSASLSRYSSQRSSAWRSR